jgi:hypothetical protein
MGIPVDIVMPDGTLNANYIIKRETLYLGMNGQAVERIYLTPSQSYIFKPLTNNDQWGKEMWVYEHVLPAFPDIYPKLIAGSSDAASGLHWILFEDLGPLRHDFQEALALKVVAHTAWWHALPSGHLAEAPLRGPKPFIEEVAAELLRDRAEIMQGLPALSIPAEKLESVYAALEMEPFTKERVLSHGDLHSGNYALAGQRLMILDWEHTHLNSRLWDLYHIIDMSHPVFPKTVTSRTRDRLLAAYAEQAELGGHPIDTPAFMREYARFTCAFSIWMIRFILQDLSRNETKWPRQKLERQLTETIGSFNQCSDRI